MPASNKGFPTSGGATSNKQLCGIIKIVPLPYRTCPPRLRHAPKTLAAIWGEPWKEQIEIWKDEN
ncbi:MAG: hypothetical protein LBC84_03140 [Prevotellaceae bacterium]|nr:hypothetical protein [Prevotellaceae bacterium]